MFGDRVCFDADTESRALLPKNTHTICFTNTSEAQQAFGIEPAVYATGEKCAEGTRGKATITVNGLEILLVATEGFDNSTLVSVISHDPACQK
jgi:hypothetical protein